MKEVLTIEDYGCTGGKVNRVHSIGAAVLQKERQRVEREGDNGQTVVLSSLLRPKTDQPTTKCPLVTDQD